MMCHPKILFLDHVFSDCVIKFHPIVFALDGVFLGSLGLFEFLEILSLLFLWPRYSV